MNKPTIDWVEIDAGAFRMGSLKSDPERVEDEILHLVTLSAYKMSKYAITFEQYDAYCESIGIEKPFDEGWGRGQRPVINVSWTDARNFAEWLGCRLPTEAEWEYACRAGTTTPFYTGSNLTTKQANYNGKYPYNSNAKGKYRGRTLTVGSFAPNAWGLYDMHGNVYEWCSDWYDDYTLSSLTNPQGPSSGIYRVRRGGAWNFGAQFCRSASRSYRKPEYPYDSTGFRLVSIC